MYIIIKYIPCYESQHYVRKYQELREWSCKLYPLGRPSGLVPNMCRFNISLLMDAPLFQAYFEKRMPRDFSKSLGNPFERVPTGTKNIQLPTYPRIGCTYLYTLMYLHQFSICLFIRVRPFRLQIFFASKRIVSEQRSVSHEIRLFTSSFRFPFFRFFRLFSLQIFCNYSLYSIRK
jgi:hypothetical protein